MKAQIILADDHEIFREGMKSMLESTQKIKVMGEASTGLEVLDLLNKMKVDLVLLDINMPKMNGLETASIISKQYPEIKVLILSMFNDAKHIQEVMKSGATGYVLKDSSKKILLEGISAVLDGASYYVDEVKEILFNSLKNDSIKSKVQLTTKEKQILKLICEEYSTYQIADELNISTHTVESHRKNLLAKTGAKTAVGLVRFALDNTDFFD